jgi:two-component system chemotaxis sensor kinase CheA
MDAFDAEIKQFFLEEARQDLDNVEEAFIKLDAGDRSTELIDRIFRLAHTFKGSAMAVGFSELSKFAHLVEDGISLVRSGKREPDRQMCTFLLKCLDALKAFVDGLKGDLSFTLDTSSLAQELALLQGKGAEQNPVLPEVPASSGADISPGTVSAPMAPMAPMASKAKDSEREAIRVSTLKLDTLLNLVGELVVNQSIITSHRMAGTTGSDHAVQTLSYIEKLVLEIQNISMMLRMVPIKPVFQKMNRIVRDLSVLQSKDIQFEADGEHVELDKSVLDRITDPLTHLIRNAVDHGLESQDERLLAKKPGQGHVRVSAQQKEERILITVSDDGRGLDPEKIRQKAIEKGLISSSDQLTPQECYSLIFRSGFSTKEVVTDVSGRGVGMDVVQTAVEELKGTIQIETILGKGTSFIVSLPLSLSIISGMVVEVDEKKYVVPVSQLVEIIEYGKFAIQRSGPQARMLNLRGEILPILSLSQVLHGRTQDGRELGGKFPGLVTFSQGKKVSFEVDQILGQQQIVIKKLGREIEGLPGVLGGAVLSNGEASLIIDLHDIYRMVNNERPKSTAA